MIAIASNNKLYTVLNYKRKDIKTWKGNSNTRWWVFGVTMTMTDDNDEEITEDEVMTMSKVSKSSAFRDQDLTQENKNLRFPQCRPN